MGEEIKSRVSRVETDINWLKKELNEIKHELKKKVDKSEIRIWFTVIFAVLTILQVMNLIGR